MSTIQLLNCEIRDEWAHLLWEIGRDSDEVRGPYEQGWVSQGVRRRGNF